MNIVGSQIESNLIYENKPLIHFGFLLLNQFTLISLASAIEPLRMANRVMDKTVYSWATLSEINSSVVASDGVVLNTDHIVGANISFDILFICGGINVEENFDKPLLKWLKKIEQQGVSLGAICTGTYVLAAADLLDGYHCSIHWENMTILKELYPQLQVSSYLYSIDRNRYTCSGGTAPIDMMLDIISRQNGAQLSAAIAEQLICDRVRQADDQQRVPLQHLIGSQSKKLVMAIKIMETNLEEPLKLSELSKHVDLSCRQLERLFQKYLFCTPSRYYIRLRLQHAKKLLRNTHYTVTEIASICGFISTAHFSSSYKEFFGHPPSHENVSQYLLQ